MPSGSKARGHFVHIKKANSEPPNTQPPGSFTVRKKSYDKVFWCEFKYSGEKKQIQLKDQILAKFSLEFKFYQKESKSWQKCFILYTKIWNFVKMFHQNSNSSGNKQFLAAKSIFRGMIEFLAKQNASFWLFFLSFHLICIPLNCDKFPVQTFKTCHIQCNFCFTFAMSGYCCIHFWLSLDKCKKSNVKRLTIF